jgi:hypothetical protein
MRLHERSGNKTHTLSMEVSLGLNSNILETVSTGFILIKPLTSLSSSIL